MDELSQVRLEFGGTEGRMGEIERRLRVKDRPWHAGHLEGLIRGTLCSIHPLLVALE